MGFDYFFGVPFVGQLPHVFIENGYVVDLESGDPIRLVADPRPAFRAGYLQRPRTDNPNLRVTGGRRATYVQEDLAITLTQKAVAFIRENARRPFFLYFAHRNIHAPLAPNARFRGSSEIGVYGDFIHELDWSVGEVLHTLDQLALTDNTLVIFSSDNGAVSMGHKPLVGRVDYSGHKANGPWRGQKTEVYEGGHRVPFLARWPGHVPAGASSGQLLALTDMLATFSALLDQPLPHDAGEDSVNLLPALLGRDGGAPLRETLVHDSWKGLFAVRQGPWKLIQGPGGGGIGWKEAPQSREPSLQLYNLVDDPGETTNLCADKPEIVAQADGAPERDHEGWPQSAVNGDEAGVHGGTPHRGCRTRLVEVAGKDRSRPVRRPGSRGLLRLNQELATRNLFDADERAGHLLPCRQQTVRRSDPISNAARAVL